jgi:fibronectin type III domain protein
MRRRQFRPNVETMEDRLVLSTVKLTPSILKVKPAPPTFGTTASATQVNLAWNKVSGASQYLVREMINGRWVQLKKLNNKTTGFAISGLRPSTAYTLDVACVKGGRVYWMPARSAVTLPPAPTAPTWHATAVSTSQINLSWNQVPNATSYVIEEFTAKGWSVIASTTGTSYAVTGLRPNTSYWFDIAALNASGTVWGNPYYATTLTPTITSTVVAWCYAQLGHKVGNGQCADLANQALIATGYKTFYQTGGPTGPDSDYVWGQLVATITTANCKNNWLGTIQSGDILQYSNVTTVHTTTNPNGTWSSVTMTATHHTAVATGTESDSWPLAQPPVSSGTIVDTLEQNDNGAQLVVENQLYLADLTGGTIWVYRPINA